MTDSNFSAIRARLRYESIEEFIDGYARFISAGGMFIPMAPNKLKPIGTTIRFQFLLANGSTALLGEGAVVQVRPPDEDNPKAPVGMLVKYSKLSQESKNLVDQIVAMKEFGAVGDAPEPEPEPEQEEQASEPEAAEAAAMDEEVADDDPTYEMNLDDYLARDAADADDESEEEAATEEEAPAEDEVEFEEPEEPEELTLDSGSEATHGPRQLGKTEGGLQILAFDNMSDEEAGAFDLDLGAEESDIDEMFAGLFGGGGGGDDDGGFFAGFGDEPQEEPAEEPEEEEESEEELLEESEEELLEEQSEELLLDEPEAELAEEEGDEDELLEESEEELLEEEPEEELLEESEEELLEEEPEEELLEEESEELLLEEESEELLLEEESEELLLEEESEEEALLEEESEEEALLEEESEEEELLEEEPEEEELLEEPEEEELLEEPEEEELLEEESEELLEAAEAPEPEAEEDELPEAYEGEGSSLSFPSDWDEDEEPEESYSEPKVSVDEAFLDESEAILAAGVEDEEVLELDSEVELIEPSESDELEAPEEEEVTPEEEVSEGEGEASAPDLELAVDEGPSELENLLGNLESSAEDHSMDIHLANDPHDQFKEPEPEEAPEDEDEESLDFLLAAASRDIAAKHADDEPEAKNTDILDDLLGEDANLPPPPSDTPLFAAGQAQPQKKKGFLSKLFGKD